MCAKGSTFRDCFDNWFEGTSNVTAITNSLGKEKPVGRRQANYTFSVFLNKLSFPAQEHLKGLFSGTECEDKTADGEVRFDSVVKDGTATGILIELPNF